MDYVNDPNIVAKVQGLRKKGWKDKQIADKLGFSLKTVARIRNKLGLPRFQATKSLRRRLLRITLHHNGAASFVQLRLRKERLAVLLAGWPGGTTAAEADLLQVFYDNPPMQISDIADIAAQKLNKKHVVIRRRIFKLLRDGVLEKSKTGEISLKPKIKDVRRYILESQAHAKNSL